MFFDLEGVKEDPYQPLIHNLYLECVLELVCSFILGLRDGSIPSDFSVVFDGCWLLLLFGPIIWVPADTSLNLGNISKDLYCSCVDHLSSHLVLELVGCFIVDLYVTERGNMEERGICRQDKIASRGLSDYLGT